MAELVFNMGSISKLSEEVTDTDTLFEIDDIQRFLQKGGTGDFFYLQLIGTNGVLEIVKVDVGASDEDGLVVERGQEGTSATDWPRGSIVWQGLTEESLDRMLQIESTRSIATDPNGVLTSNYFGEKVFQTGDNLWWKATGDGTTEWKLIAGVLPGPSGSWTTRETFVNPTPIGLYYYNAPLPGNELWGVLQGSYFLFNWDGADMFTVPMSNPGADITANVFDHVVAFGNDIYVGFDDGVVRHYEYPADGTTWQNAGSPLGSGEVRVLLVLGGNLYAVRSTGSGSTLSVYAGGTTWNALPLNTNALEITAGAIDALNNRMFFGAQTGEFLIYDVGGGGPLTALPGTKPSNNKLRSIDVFITEPYAVHNGYLYKHDVSTGYVQITTNRPANNIGNQMKVIGIQIWTWVDSVEQLCKWGGAGSSWEFSDVMPDGRSIEGIHPYLNEIWASGGPNRLYSWGPIT